MKLRKKKQEFNYFDEFIKNAKLAQEIVKTLREIIEEFNLNELEEKASTLHEIENKADENLHNLKNYLLKDFLPPIDREDILNIAHKIDDIIDGVDEIIIDMNIFNIDKIREEMILMLDLLVGTVNKTYELLVDFKNMKDLKLIREKAVEVNGLEEQGDRLFEKAIKDLYLGEKNVVEVLKWTNIFKAIENTYDACENVADCIEEVLMKNC